MSVEEHEEIPWSMLVDYERKTRSRSWYVLAAVVLAVVVGVTGVRWVEGRRHGELAATPVTVTTAASPITASPTTMALATEAGLLAADPAAHTLGAIATAEWFVTDYFTIDGAPTPELDSLFTTDALLPEFPGEAEDGPVSFVEWARATATRPRSGGGVVVTVLFRTLYENADGLIERSPVRAVDVVVLVDGDQTAIGELPMPIDVPTHDIAGWAAPTAGTAPPEAEAVALERAARLGAEPMVAATGELGDGWRVVVTVADPSGARFPVAVRSES